MVVPRQIFIGSEEEYLCSIAQQCNKNAFLLTSANLDAFLNDKTAQTVYTSLPDMPKDLNVLWKVFMHADLIHYCPPEEWYTNIDDEDFFNVTSNVRGLTETILIAASNFVTVTGLDIINTVPWHMKLPNNRNTSDPCLFVAGCSNTFGSGVNANQTYSFLLAQSLKMERVLLADKGTSLAWAADKILRSDIKKDDIVVWGLTSLFRFTAYHEKQLVRLNANSYNTVDKNNK